MIRLNEAIDHVMIRSMSTYTERLILHRDQSAAIVEHDLKNPLTTIIVSASILGQHGKLDEQDAQVVSRIRSSATRMNALLSDLLDLTRSRFGASLPITLRPTDLVVVTDNVVSELRALHPDSDLRFESRGELQGEWDSKRLEQVISSLVSNALVHGARGAPVLVTAAPQDGGVVVTVRNEGPAIPETDLERIFEPAFRGEGARPGKNTANLGLGLFIVREVVRAHGGQVTVTSSAEGGTTFTVRLPRTPLKVAA
jgi:phosphoserine phosphatase RsbU/P